jgi:GNAT superfamily N-acetyltransferase
VGGSGVRAAQICLRDAWPAPVTADCYGWLLRAGQGGYNRVNSVWTGSFSGETGDLPAAIERAEAFYRGRGLKPRFQILGIVQPAGLDAELARRGYGRALGCADMVKAVEMRAMPVEVSARADCPEDWLGLYAAEQPPEKAAELPLILASLPGRHGFVLCRRAGAPAGVALVGQVDDDVAVDCVLTAPGFRRAGVGRSVMRGAEAWAAAQGARRLVLSVVDGNAAAIALYRDLGYRELAAYHYRVAGS